MDRSPVPPPASPLTVRSVGLPPLILAPRTPVELVHEGADAIHAVFDAYHAQFDLVTRRARARFARCDWRGAQQDAFERLSLYRQFTDWVVGDLQRLLDAQAYLPETWTAMKWRFAELVEGRGDVELAYTFFNSASRRLLRTRGVATGQEFVAEDFERIGAEAAEATHRTYRVENGLAPALRALLEDFQLETRFRDLEQDAALAAEALAADLAHRDPGAIHTVEMLPTLFYRNKGAYAVGRIRWNGGLVPLVIPLMNGPAGVEVDAVLSTTDEASVVFSFTRSYFHVEAERPRATVEFLRSIMPLKPIDELYTAIGYHKHGKTELYLALQHVLRNPEGQFQRAAGDEGLVMSVFALPRLNIVFKIIKDRFGAPKTSTRADVINKYHLVFVRDRVGRLADAQEFEGLEFRRGHFEPGLLDRLVGEAGTAVRVDGDRVIVHHLYTERRVTPLNLFLKTAAPEAAVDAVLDYGQSIKDLAAANIFTGDMLLKNFGVTRHGRVIFYDYDELCLLTECNFRRIPPPRDPDEEMAAEPWFHVGERDVFPEEFRFFLLLPGRLGEVFLAAHGDLLDVAFWKRMQDRQAAGEVVDFFPYRPARRLRKDG
jgi:isocitrate dehydrogenase kinase/phosphatase